MKKAFTLSAMTITSLVSLTGCDSGILTTLGQYIDADTIATLLTGLISSLVA